MKLTHTNCSWETTLSFEELQEIKAYWLIQSLTNILIGLALPICYSLSLRRPAMLVLTPSSIPNRISETTSADDSAVLPCESRSLPNTPETPIIRGLCWPGKNVGDGGTASVYGVRSGLRRTAARNFGIFISEWPVLSSQDAVYCLQPLKENHEEMFVLFCGVASALLCGGKHQRGFAAGAEALPGIGPRRGARHCGIP